ncbi:class I SAM-dependent methyltransferase [Fodinibius halophilus]|uniref:Class I SAM-dependent methyltransferase n=1 Tax=Fodinibius halophilus TaxID=1736908 RepID=A0A6M1T598_9BACT|nr:class I SAM-dependent methyltransferase [Fodinibius halophilus]NGP87131.1 class I SAM-dependent methyltransferase [Fodinibius halophilus]
MSNNTDQIREAYDEWAQVYDSKNNLTRDLNYEAIRKASLDLESKEILEIGCGTGLNTAFLAEQAKNVTGVDISEEMLAKARQRVSTGIDFTVADITEPWDFKDESFDLIVGNLVLEHVKDLSHVFSEASRVLRTDGKLYLAELHPYKQLQQSQAKFTRQETGEEVLVNAFTHPVSEYVNEAINAGFEILRMQEYQSEKDDIPRLITLFFEKK